MECFTSLECQFQSDCTFCKFVLIFSFRRTTYRGSRRRREDDRTTVINLFSSFFCSIFEPSLIYAFSIVFFLSCFHRDQFLCLKWRYRPPSSTWLPPTSLRCLAALPVHRGSLCWRTASLMLYGDWIGKRYVKMRYVLTRVWLFLFCS